MSLTQPTDTLTPRQRCAIRRKAANYLVSGGRSLTNLSRDELLKELMDTMDLVEGLIDDTSAMRDRAAKKGWMV